MDVAIVKATNHVECPPKERHLRSEYCLLCGVFSFAFFSSSFLIFCGRSVLVDDAYPLITEILLATSAVRPRADVAYCLHALARRLEKTRNWTVLSSA